MSTFDARRLKARDFIDILGRTESVLLRFPNIHVPEPNWFSFRRAGPAVMAPGARLRGFLYYHTSYPRQFLSGGLRFRCTDHPGHSSPPLAFEAGRDLLDEYLLPWELSLPTLLRKIRYHTFLSQLVLDGFLTEEKIRKARKLLLHTYDSPLIAKIPASFIHDIEQPFLMDLSLPTRIRVVGPHSVFNVPIYPAVAYGGKRML